ncbi:TPA: hypothetical protein ACGJ7A_005752 [Pseudomonas aeruginosa]
MIQFNIYNPNSRSTTSIEIYREESGVNIPDEPVNPPIQIHDGFVTSIIDNNTEVGKTYNYRVRLVQTGNTAVMGPQFECTASSIFGPGEYHKPIMQSVDSAYLGLVDASEGLPTASELISKYGGSLSTVYGWTNKWIKFKHGNSIYYTPYKGYIHILYDLKERFTSVFSKTKTIAKNGYTYGLRYKDDVNNTILNVLDGYYPAKYPLPCENIDCNMCTAAARVSGIDTYYTYVITRVEDTNNAACYFRHGPVGTLGTSAKHIGSITGVSDSSKFYWKPVLELISTNGVA